MSQYVKLARVTTPVPFNGPACVSLLCRHGLLVWHGAENLLECTPDTTPNKSVIIPSTNIAFLELMSPGETEQYLAERLARRNPAPKPAPAPAVKPAPAQDDTVVFVKDPRTGAISERRKTPAPPPTDDLADVLDEVSDSDAE